MKENRPVLAEFIYGNTFFIPYGLSTHFSMKPLSLKSTPMHMIMKEYNIINLSGVQSIISSSSKFNLKNYVNTFKHELSKKNHRVNKWLFAIYPLLAQEYIKLRSKVSTAPL